MTVKSTRVQGRDCLALRDLIENPEYPEYNVLLECSKRKLDPKVSTDRFRNLHSELFSCIT